MSKQIYTWERKHPHRGDEFKTTEFYDAIKDTYRTHGVYLSGIQKFAHAPRRSCETCKKYKLSPCKFMIHPTEVSASWGLIYLIRIFQYLGLFYEIADRSRCSISFLYSGVVNFILWLNFFRMFGAYDENTVYGSKLFVKISLQVFYGQVALVHTLYLTSVTKQFPKLLSMWDDFSVKYNCRTGENVRRLVIRSIILASILVAAVSLVFGLNLFYWSTRLNKEEPLVRIIHGPFYQENSPPLPVQIAFFLISFLVALLWAFPTALITVICKGLSRHFRQLTAEIHEDINLFSKAKKDIIEGYRTRHQKLCKIVKFVDHILSSYNLTVYSTCIPLICLSLYNFAFRTHDENFVMLIVCIFTLVFFNIQMGLITSAASSLSSQASAPRDVLYDINLDVSSSGSQVDLQQAVQVNLFLQRIIHDHIGLTAWNVFNITRGTIMLVVTMVLSYVFVLIKYGLTLEYHAPTTCDCNCSGITAD